VRGVDINVITNTVVKEIKELPGLKNPLPKRKLGNRIVFAVSKGIGEAGLDSEPTLRKLVSSICLDDNYKIRRDGVFFLKEYFKDYK